jgi:hypothetical protein
MNNPNNDDLPPEGAF